MASEYKNFPLKRIVFICLVYEKISYPGVFQYQITLDRKGKTVVDLNP